MMQSPISLAEIKLTLLAAKVDYEQLNECLIWAFGSTEPPIKDWVKLWNENHKDIFEMQGSQTVFDSVYQVGIAFVKKKEHQEGLEKNES